MFISEGHKIAMTIKGNDVALVNTRLVKGNKPPPKAFTPDNKSIDTLTLTKVYAVEAAKTVSL